MPTPRSRVVVTDFLDETDLERPILEDVARLETLGAWHESELVGRVEDAAVLLVYHDIPHIGDATFARLDGCVGIVRAGVGYNNLDVAAAAARGIVVCNVPDYGSEDVADHALMLLLAVSRKLIDCHAAIRGGDWHYRTILGCAADAGADAGDRGDRADRVGDGVAGEGAGLGRGLL